MPSGKVLPAAIGLALTVGSVCLSPYSRSGEVASSLVLGM